MSEKGTVLFSCPCGERHRADVWRAFDRERDTEAGAALDDGTLNQTRCPHCDRRRRVEVVVVENDPRRKRVTVHLPDGLRHRELEERALYLSALAAATTVPPSYAFEPEIRFLPLWSDGPRPILSSDSEPEHEVEELAAPGASAAEVEVGYTPTKQRVKLVDLRQTALERWAQQKDPPQAITVDSDVLVCASLPAEAAMALAKRAELRIQLHRLPTYPLITLTLLSRSDENTPKPTEWHSRKPPMHAQAQPTLLMVPLDISRAAHRAVLDALGKRCAIELALHDENYRLLSSVTVAAPLETNVRLLRLVAKEALGRLSPAQRNFERARVLIASTTYERLGRLDVAALGQNLELERPSEVWKALAEVRRWSEPSAEAYLVETRSQPLDEWYDARGKVVWRALSIGLAVGRTLVERVTPHLPSPPPSWPELVNLLCRRFAALAVDKTRMDLSTAEPAANWTQRLDLCERSGVRPDPQTELLAAQAQQRVRVAESGSGIDLRALGSDDLVALLDEARLRRQAAVVLCERREADTLGPLFSALKRMTRAEANAVLPAVTGYGAAAEPWLIEALKSKKAFMRQGCALALGALATRKSTDALAQLLCEEPTEIWGEVARAIGDVGEASIASLAAQLGQLRGDATDGSVPLTVKERYDRIVRALAHVARRAQPAVELAKKGRDAKLARACTEALAMREGLEHADAALRRGSAEHTVVRGFSRRFYDGLRGDGDQEAGEQRPAPEGTGSIELDAGDFEELDTGEALLPEG